MGKYKQAIKKMITFMLLSALVITFSNPVYSYADENGTMSGAETTDSTGGTTGNGNIATGSNDSPPHTDLSPQNDNSNAQAGTTPAATPTPESIPVPQADSPKDTTERTTENSQYDTTKPVIENVVFDQQGKTLKENDTIRMELYAYDADSGIRSVDVTLYSDANYHEQSMNASFDEQKKCYIFEYTLTDTYANKIYVSRILVTDNRGNYVNWDTTDSQNGNYRYWVNVEQKDAVELRVKNFTLNQNGKTVNETDTLELSLETEGELTSNEVYVSFENEDGNTWDTCLYNYDSVQRLYTADTSTGVYYTDGKYTLKRIFARLGAFGQETELQMSDTDKENFSFTLKKTAAVVPSVDTEAPIITSVEIERNGDVLLVGNSINITVSATDNVDLQSYGYLYLYAVSDIVDSQKDIYLQYDENDKKYHGTFTVTEDTYPCEWYVGSISIWDMAGNYADDGSYTRDIQYPYYVYVKNTNTFVYPTYDLNIDFFVLNEYGGWENVQSIEKKKVDRRSTLKEAGITFPEMSSKYSDFVQIGWGDYSGNEITLDTRIVENTYMAVYAVYDKNRINVEYNFPNTEGKWETKSQPIYFETGETYGNIIKKAQEFIPENISKDYSFDGWDYDGYFAEDSVITEYDSYLTLTAKIPGKTMLRVNRTYYNEKGCRASENDFEIFTVDEGTSVADTIQYLKGLELPKMYPGLKFNEWNIFTVNDIPDAVAENGDIIRMDAAYENCIVRFVIDPRFEYEYPFDNNYDETGFEAMFCQVAEPGSTITFPESLEGYDELSWSPYQGAPAPGDSFTVTENVTFYAYPGKASEEPDHPITRPSVTPGGTDNSGTSGGSGNPDKPSTPAEDNKLPEDKVNDIVKTITEFTPGSEPLKIEMGGVTVVPKEILEAAKGKDIKLNLDMGGYTWTINGTDIASANLQDINMQVTLDTNNIPNSTLRALAGDNPIRQLSLAHEGDFGFKATLTVNVGAEHAGQYGNLYYHDSEGKMVFIDGRTISPEGNVSLEFSHASDYVIVMSDEPMGNPGNTDNSGKPSKPSGNGSGSTNKKKPQSVNSMKDPTQTPLKTTPTDTAGNQTATSGRTQSAENTSQSQTKSVNTGDNTPVLPLIVCSISALGILICLMKKRKAA